MKKTVLFVLLSICTTLTYAQENTVIGASFQYITSNYKHESAKSSESQMTFAIDIGKRVNEFAFGLSVGIYDYQNSNQDYYFSEYDYSDNESYVFLGPYLRRYYLINERLSAFSNFMLGGIIIDSKNTVLSINLDAGVLYDLSEKLKMQIILGGLDYQSQTNKNTDATFTTINLEYNLTNPQIGFKYHFLKKKKLQKKPRT